MTRRGSLIYYLSAWILGCFFMSLVVWIKDEWGAVRIAPALSEGFGLLFFYFYGMVVGAAAALIGAFLLRRMAIWLKCKTPAHWAILGGALAPALIGVLGAWGRHLDAGDAQRLQLLSLLTFGPKTVLEAGWWLAIPSGAATGYFLGRIQRAFDPARHADAGAKQASA